MDFAQLMASISSHEGTGPVVGGRYMPYTDTTGHLSIGRGINLAVGLSPAEESFLFNNRLQIATGSAESQDWWQYVAGNDARANALVECVFNLGIDGVAEFHVALASMAAGDWSACGAAFLDSLWARQIGKRAEVLANMIISGEFPT